MSEEKKENEELSEEDLEQVAGGTPQVTQDIKATKPATTANKAADALDGYIRG
jgi:hypothetical protein